MSEVLELQPLVDTLNDNIETLNDKNNKLIYSNTIDTTNIQNILLISSKIRNSKIFYDSANSNTFPIIYSFNSDKIELLDLLKEKFQNGIKRISLAFHDPGSNNRVLFLDNTSFFQDTDLLENQTTFSEGVNFVIQLITEFRIGNFDFLACNSLQYSNWVDYYALLTKETNVICGASTDDTGNILYGADWIMENTNENIMYTYFTDSITSYAGSLATITLSMAGHATNTIQIRQSGYIIQYSSDAAHTTWTSLDSTNSPLNIVNTSATNPKTVLTVEFITYITMDQNRYFYINIGSSYITINGNNNTVKFHASDGYVTVYDGLIDNATGFHTITVKNIIASLDSSRIYGVITNSPSQGFICRSYFGQNINKIAGFDPSLNAIYITNCTLTCPNNMSDNISLAKYYGGDFWTVYNNFKINNNGGGICGAYFGNDAVSFVTDCTNYYPVGSKSGGIIGPYAGRHTTTTPFNTVLTITNCNTLYATPADAAYGKTDAFMKGGCGILAGENCCLIDSSTYILNFAVYAPKSTFGTTKAVLNLINCTNEMDYYATAPNAVSAGIMGRGVMDGNTLNMTNCTNKGNGVGSAWSGGLMAGPCIANKCIANIINCTNSGIISGDYSGGFMGLASCHSSTLTLTNCINTGQIGSLTSNSTNSGGFFAPGSCYAGSIVTLNKCNNTGALVATNGFGEGSGGFGASGVGNASSVTLNNCSSIMNLSQIPKRCGGLFSYDFGRDSTVGCTIDSCYVKITLTGTNNAGNFGGLCGENIACSPSHSSAFTELNTKMTVKNCCVDIYDTNLGYASTNGGLFASVSSTPPLYQSRTYSSYGLTGMTVTNCYFYCNNTAFAALPYTNPYDNTYNFGTTYYNSFLTKITPVVYISGGTSRPWSDSSANKILTGYPLDDTTYRGTVWTRTYTPSVDIANALNTPYSLVALMPTPAITSVSASSSFAFIYINGSDLTSSVTIDYNSSTILLTNFVANGINTQLTVTMPYHVQYTITDITVHGQYNDVTYRPLPPITSEFLGITGVDASNNYRELYIDGTKLTSSCTFVLKNSNSAIISIGTPRIESSTRVYIPLASSYYDNLTNYDIKTVTVTDSSAPNEPVTYNIPNRLQSDYPTITGVTVSDNDYRYIYIAGENLTGTISVILRESLASSTPITKTSDSLFVSATQIRVAMVYPTNYNLAYVTVSANVYTKPNYSFARLTSNFPEIKGITFADNTYNTVNISGYNLNGTNTNITLFNLSSHISAVLAPNNATTATMTITHSNINYTVTNATISNAKYTSLVHFDVDPDITSLIPQIIGVSAPSENYGSLNINGQNFKANGLYTVSITDINDDVSDKTATATSTTNITVSMGYSTNYTIKSLYVADSACTSVVFPIVLTSDFPEIIGATFDGTNYNKINITGFNLNLSGTLVKFLDSATHILTGSTILAGSTQTVINMSLSPVNINYIITAMTVTNQKYPTAVAKSITLTSLFPQISRVAAPSGNYSSFDITGKNFQANGSYTVSITDINDNTTSKSATFESVDKLNVVMNYPTNYTIKSLYVADSYNSYISDVCPITEGFASDFPEIKGATFLDTTYNTVQLTGDNLNYTGKTITLYNTADELITSSTTGVSQTVLRSVITHSNINYIVAKVTISNATYTTAVPYDIPLALRLKSLFPEIISVSVSNNDYKSFDITGINFLTGTYTVTLKDEGTLPILGASVTRTNGTTLHVVMNYPTNYTKLKYVTVYNAPELYTSNIYPIPNSLTSDFTEITDVDFSGNNPRYVTVHGIHFTASDVVSFNVKPGDPPSPEVKHTTYINDNLLQVEVDVVYYNIWSVMVANTRYSDTRVLDPDLYGIFPHVSGVLPTDDINVFHITGFGFQQTDTVALKKPTGSLSSSVYETQLNIQRNQIQITVASYAVYYITSVEVTDTYNNKSNTFRLTSPLIKQNPTVALIDISGNNYAYINISGTEFTPESEVNFTTSNGNIIYPIDISYNSSSELTVKMDVINYDIYKCTVISSSMSAYREILNPNDNLISYFPTIDSVTNHDNDYNYVYIGGLNFKVEGTTNVSGVKINNIRHTGTVEIISNSLLKVTMVSNVNYVITSVSVIDMYNNIITSSYSVTSYFPEITSVSPSADYRMIYIDVINFTDVTYEMIKAVSFVSSSNAIVIPYSVDTLNNEKTKLTVTMVSPDISIINYSISKVNVTIDTAVFTYSLEPTIESFNTEIKSLVVDSVNNEDIHIYGNNFTEEFTKITINYGTTPYSKFEFKANNHLLLTMRSTKYFIYNIAINNINDTSLITYDVVTGANNDKVLISPMLETLLSNICFPSETPVTTDQGDIPIEQINSHIHTIRGKKIIGITKTVTHDTYLVCFEKDSLGNNIPSQKTVISQNHLILYKEEMIKAKEFIRDFANVYKIKYNGEVLYNVLMEEHDTMIVNNLICETLDPENGTAKIYGILETLPKESQQFVIEKMNELVIKHDVFNNVNSKYIEDT
jgi:hypothetical protein